MYPKGTLRSILKLLLPQILLLYEKIEFFLQIKIKNKKDLIKLQMFIEPYKSLKKIFDDEKEALLYLISNDYVNKHIKCNKCEHETKLNLNKKLYVCRYYKCRKAISPLKGTIFNNLTLPLNTQLHILYLFLGKAPSSFIASSLQISKNTVSSYNKIFRKYLKNKQLLGNRNIKIGGRNKIVEIDESKIAKRKYNKGHKVEGAWVIGGIERSTLKNKIKNENKKMFLLPIEERNVDNIDLIIKRYVKKGTTIYTDLWKGYNNLKNIGYKHLTVNHSKHFKDPNTGVHTNTIEGAWNGLKQSIIPRNRNKKDIVLYLKEYQ
jgi:16S rRNA G966 N2-methylase RsmD